MSVVYRGGGLSRNNCSIGAAAVVGLSGGGMWGLSGGGTLGLSMRGLGGRSGRGLLRSPMPLEERSTISLSPEYRIGGSRYCVNVTSSASIARLRLAGD